MKVIVCGGGIIGCSTVYFLAKRGISSVLVESQSVACCASGKAGGFLAREWCNDHEWGPFAQASFDLHMELAEEFPNCDYRCLDSITINLSNEETKREEFVYLPDQKESVEIGANSCANPSMTEQPQKSPNLEQEEKSSSGSSLIPDRPGYTTENDPSCVPEWVDGQVTFAFRTGHKKETAQVHPRKLCESLLEAARKLSLVEVRERTQIIGFVRQGVRLSGVRLQKSKSNLTSEETLNGDAVVIAMGPWSVNAVQWLGLPPMVSSCRGHSLVLRPSPSDWPKVTATAVLADMQDTNGEDICMEIYPRPDGTIYVCGFSDYVRLPSSGDTVVPSESSIQRLRGNIGRVSSILSSSVLLSRQACLMPKSDDDRFIIGGVPGVPAAYIGSCHSYWGILCGPATGKALSELILDGQCSSFDLQAFRPSRFFCTSR